MSSSYTPSLTLTQIGNGEQSGTWGTTTNTNWQLIEDAVAGVATVTVSGTSGATLSVANGTTDQARKAVIVVTGSASGTNAIVAPLQPKVYLVSNQTTGGFNITIGASTGSVVTIPSGVTTLVYCDGTNFSSGITGFTGGNLSITGNITATGTITGATFATSGGVPQLAGGAANNLVYQTGANATSYISAPPSTGSSTFLAYTPGTGFNWQTSSTTASNINGGAANNLVYQTGASTTSFITAPSSSGQILTWNGSQIQWATGGSVTSFSAGTTGLTPSTPSTGAIVLGGVLNVANGGTQLSSSGASGNLLVSNGSAWTSSTPASAGLVDTSSTQTIGGTKTFSNNITTPAVNSSGSNLSFDIGGTQYVTINTIPILFPNTDNTVTLGGGGNRWTQVFAVNGTINTSDANEKQQVSALTTAELAVAKALKGLIVTFKFNDAVAKKGANARIHTGVIAQQVQAAFTAQGLDANKYGLFCSDTWYEVNGKNYDENGQPYTATSPNALEVTRLGVRYDELLAFIIAGL